MPAFKSRPARLFLSTVLAFAFLLVFGIQAAFATPGSYFQSPTQTPISLADLCEDNGGEWFGRGSYKDSCEYFPPYRPYGKSGASTNGNHAIENPPAPTILHLSGEKNGSVILPQGACPLQCTLNAQLPRGADNDLPASAVAALYVRMVDESGIPGDHAYWVCFDSKKLDDPAIFKYVEGRWLRLTGSRPSNPFCVYVSGEGAFYLGEG